MGWTTNPECINLRMMKQFVFLIIFSASALNLFANIRLDGQLSDWKNHDTVELLDPTGDTVRAGEDITAMLVTHDAETVFVAVTFASPFPTTLPDLSVLADVDDNSETGFSYIGLGVDASFRLPEDFGSWTHQDAIDLDRGAFIIRSFYSPDTGVLEFAIPTTLIPASGWNQAFGLAVYERNSLDRLPNFGDEPFRYTFNRPVRRQSLSTSLEKRHSGDLRILSWNVLRDNLTDPNLEERFGRVLQAVQPDIICFQELYNASTPQAIQLVNKWLPLSGDDDGFWTARKIFDNITVSRFPILRTTAVNNNLITVVDTSDKLGRQSWILNAHTPCCDNQSGRLQETDNFMRVLRDDTEAALMEGENRFAIFLVGDMNTAGSEREMITMLEGDIHNNILYGSDFAPDWDGTSLTDLAPLHTHQYRIDTWRSLNNRLNTSRLDYIIYSDSLVLPAKRFVLNTRNVPQAFLDQYNLTAADTDAADHLPVVGDFRSVTPPLPWQPGRVDGSGWILNSWMGDVFALDFPWLFHPQLGWIYQIPANASHQAWFYSLSDGWIFASADFFSFFYTFTSQDWLRLPTVTSTWSFPN